MACDPSYNHCSPLFNHSHLEAFPAASTLLSMALLQFSPLCLVFRRLCSGSIAGKPRAAYLHWHAPGLPPIPPTVLHQLLVLLPLRAKPSALLRIERPITARLPPGNGRRFRLAASMWEVQQRGEHRGRRAKPKWTYTLLCV